MWDWEVAEEVDPLGSGDGKRSEVGGLAVLVVNVGGRRELERDDELFDPTPSFRSLLSNHKDARLRIEERYPVLLPPNRDDLEEVREREESHGFGDGEEGGRRKGGGRMLSTCWGGRRA